MNESEARDLLIAWATLPFLTPSRIRLLLEYFDPLPNACSASVATLSALLNIEVANAEEVKNPLRSDDRRESVARLRESTIALTDPGYPSILREIIDPPLVLHVRGDRTLLQQEGIAVVGSRRASPYALNAARKLVEPLARDAGLVIVSGLARGVDAAAHESALDCDGKTIAVLGTGIDVIYPRAHARLFKRIEEH